MWRTPALMCYPQLGTFNTIDLYLSKSKRKKNVHVISKVPTFHDRWHSFPIDFLKKKKSIHSESFYSSITLIFNVKIQTIQIKIL